MVTRNIIVIGASAGGVQAVIEIARRLPAEFNASVFVVIHTSPDSPGILPMLIDRAGPLSCAHAIDRETIRPGHIYVAPPDRHLLIRDDRVICTRGPKENGFRPAVDPLFRTAARRFGPRVIGVVLSGGLDDGTMGLLNVKQNGGLAVVQDPGEAVFPSMPASAIQHVEVDHVLPVGEMPAVLARLVAEPLNLKEAAMVRKTMEPDVAEIGSEGLGQRDMDGPPSGLTCPECGGALWEMKGAKLARFRCHVGHGYTGEALQADQSREVEAALWTAVRALDESAELSRRMARRSSQMWPGLAENYERRAADAAARAAVIREVIVEAERARTLRDAKHGKDGKNGNRADGVVPDRPNSDKPHPTRRGRAKAAAGKPKRKARPKKSQ